MTTLGHHSQIMTNPAKFKKIKIIMIQNKKNRNVLMHNGTLVQSLKDPIEVFLISYTLEFQIPYARHYNPLLIRDRSRILTIHKAKGHST